MEIQDEFHRAQALFLRGAYSQASDLLDSLPEPLSQLSKVELWRVRGWAKLALGETEQAYDLFQRAYWLQPYPHLSGLSPDPHGAPSGKHPGIHFGIMLLKVLAGQVKQAMLDWQRYCRSGAFPFLELADAEWHAEPVVKAAVVRIQNYPFQPSEQIIKGAAGVYCALLYRAINKVPEAFMTLSGVAVYYAPADVVRDRWLAEMVCLPPPQQPKPTPSEQARAAAQGSPQKTPTLSAEQAVGGALKILLHHPSPGRLEQQYRQALSAGRWQEALDHLSRRLLYEPNHTGSLEQRWRLYWKLDQREAAQSDLFALVDIYEKSSLPIACQRAAKEMVTRFPHDERALLKMCFLQARLDSPLELARYGRRLLEYCRRERLTDRIDSYRNWLLRQRLTPDDREEFGKKA